MYLSKPFKKDTKNLLCQLSLRSIRFYSKKRGSFQKAKYKKILSELCLLNEGNKYTLHHQFSKTLAEKSKQIFILVFQTIHRHGIPFNMGKQKELIILIMCLFLRHMTMVSYLFRFAVTLVCF